MQTSEPALSEAPTLKTARLPHTSDRERRRAAIMAPRLPAGRYLAVEDGDEVVVIELGEENVHLGRGRGADVLLEHLSVSRRHAIVVKRGEDHVLLDDRSRNGVYVNGERVSEAVLRDGDAIAIGEVALRYLDVG
jgi:pSer/pThr/pTyr-binding forkhead associated (FHA) protein